MLPLPAHESILIALLVIFLFLLPALSLTIYYWYRREDSLLNRWIKESRHRAQEGCRCVGHPKPSCPQQPGGSGPVPPAWQGQLGVHRPCSVWELLWSLQSCVLAIQGSQPSPEPRTRTGLGQDRPREC